MSDNKEVQTLYKEVLRSDWERLNRLSVKQIMLDVVPGSDGAGLEIYAESVDDVARHFDKLTDQIEQQAREIERLEAQAGSGTRSNKYRAELYDEVWESARSMGFSNVTEALRELAALRAQQPDLSDPFWKEKLAVKFCEQRCIADDAPGRAKLVDAFITGLSIRAQQSGVVLPERDALRDIVAQAIGGDTYDCMRVWSAWGVGTMSDDDFVPVVEQEYRLYEIADACLDEVTRLNSSPVSAGDDTGEPK